MGNQWTVHPVSITERFHQKYLMNEEGCWVWIGHHNWYGYGMFWNGKKEIRAHDFSYQLYNGEIPNKYDVHHVCNNPPCVNPNHLEALTRREHVYKGNNLAVIFSKKTHCPLGHPYNGDNLVINKNGSRTCRICNVRKLKEWRERRNIGKPDTARRCGGRKGWETRRINTR